MSTDNCESPPVAASNPSDSSNATSTGAASGLDSIVLALQALQKEPREKIVQEKSTSTLPTSNPTNMPPIPHGLNSTQRVVSTDSIDENDTESTPLQSPPQVKEETLTSSPAKTSEDVPVTAPAESARDPDMSENGAPALTDELSKAADFSKILADPEGWLQETENLFATLPPVDRSSINDIVVRPNDVLCGRGGETNHHPGNIRYRSLVKAYQKLYLLAKRRDKPKIAQCIVVSVRGVNGRFLKRTKNGGKGSAWVDVGNVKAREKTSQALREGAPNLRFNVNPPLASATNENTSANGRQVLVPDQSESMTAPTVASTAMPTATPTALEAMMGWRMTAACFNGTTANANGSTSSAPPVSSSSPVPALDADTEALTAQIFSKAAAQLMQHPAFHQLDQARQQEAILFELQNAKAAVESAKRTSTSAGTTSSANLQDQGRTSPMAPTASLKQQQPSNLQQHHQPYHATHDYPFFHHSYPQMHGSYWQDGSPKNPSNMNSTPDQVASLLASKFAGAQVDKSVNLQTMYRELLVAKAAATAGSSSSLAAAKQEGEESTSTNTTSEERGKKRSASSLSSTVGSVPISTPSLPVRSSTVVSDTGSETSSSTSSASSCESSTANNSESFPASSCNATTTTTKDNKTDAVASVSRGGSRLKRLKLRMKDDFN